MYLSLDTYNIDTRSAKLICWTSSNLIQNVKIVLWHTIFYVWRSRRDLRHLMCLICFYCYFSIEKFSIKKSLCNCTNSPMLLIIRINARDINPNINPNVWQSVSLLSFADSIKRPFIIRMGHSCNEKTL